MSAMAASSRFDQRSDAFADDAGSEGGDSERARQAILELEERLALSSTKSDAEIALEIAQGSQLVKAGWIRDRLLVGSTELEAAWMKTDEGLRGMCDRGELFSLEIESSCWYPAAFKTLDAGDVASVCRCLQGLDSASMFIFWHRKHGALGGQTLHEALRGGQKPGVLQVARAFVVEHLRG